MHASRHSESRAFSAAARRWRTLAWALLGAALLHAAFFAGLERSWLAPVTLSQATNSAPTVWVQDLAAQLPAVPQAAAAADTPQAPPRAAPNPSGSARGSGAGKSLPGRDAFAPSVALAVASRPADSASGVAMLPSVMPNVPPSVQPEAPPEPAAPTAQVEGQPRASVPAPPPEAAVGSHDAVPVYATLIPAPAVLQLRMRRGVVHGNAELSWRVDGARYEARLEARASGITLLTQVSQGGFDAAGIAPRRFTDKRVRRGTVAANFQREVGQDTGKVSFSGAETEIALHAGAQDRLSWMVQLAAIASAEPRLLAAQGRISMHVIGARGDAAVWQFISLGEQQADSGASATRVFKLQRLPQSAYDTQVDVWLDALPPHWPVRAHWRSGPGDPGLELWRIDTAEPR